MRVLIYDRDSIGDPWQVSSEEDRLVIAETNSAYKVSLGWCLAKWVMKKGPYEMCEILKEDKEDNYGG